ncbi:MAG: ABC transporter permease, partial [Candidatus Nanopelagicales bacterium]
MTVTVAEATTAPEEIKGRSLTQIAWGRLRRDKTFIASAIILAIIVLVAIFAPVISGWMGIDP